MNFGVAIVPQVTVATDPEDGDTEIWRNSQGDISTPTVVQVRENQTLVGLPAIREEMIYPDRTTQLSVDTIERENILPNSEPALTGANGWKLLFEEVVSKAYPEDGQHETRLVVPDSLGFSTRRELIDALAQTIPGRLKLINLSVVACYETGQLPSPEEGILVCYATDTAFECSIVALGSDGLRVVDNFRDPSLGTEAFDEQLYDAMCQKMQESGIQDPSDNDAVEYDMYDSLQEVKRALSVSEKSNFGLLVGTDVFDQTISRDDAIDYGSEYISDVTDAITQFLNSPMVSRAPTTISEHVVFIAPEDDIFPLQNIFRDRIGYDVTVGQPYELARAAAELAGSSKIIFDQDSANRQVNSENKTTETKSAVGTEKRDDIVGLSFGECEDTVSEFSAATEDPFEVLGVSPSTPISGIEEQARELVRGDADTDITAIGDALEKIQNGPHIKKVGDTTIEPLDIHVDNKCVEIGNPITLTVTNMVGDPIRGAEIHIDQEPRGVTDGRGEIETRMRQIGAHRISATRPHPADRYEFRAGKTEVAVEKRTLPLSFAACPTTVKFEETFEVSVLGNEKPVSEATIQTPDGTVSTGSDGTARLSLATPGEVTLVAIKSDTASRTYESAVRTLSVEPRAVSLEFAGVPDAIQPNSNIEFRVVDADGNGVSEATVSGQESTVMTDDDGYATLEFDSISSETITVMASKNNTIQTRYSDTEIEIPVALSRGEPGDSTLSVDYDDNQVKVGEPVTFEITDDDATPIESVYVSGTDGGNGLTDAGGQVTITFEEPGHKTVSVSTSDGHTHEDYQPTTCTINVERQVQPLMFEEVPSTVSVGKSVDFGVVTADGTPVSKAILKIDGTEKTRTNNDGQATIVFNELGQHILQVSKEPSNTTKYESDTQEINVQNTLKFKSSPDSARPGEPLKFRLVDSTGEPISGAIVQGPNERSEPTDDDGTTELVLQDEGLVHLKAVMPDDDGREYNEGLSTIRVRGDTTDQ
jgi:uncharacterized GH25 family protein